MPDIIEKLRITQKRYEETSLSSNPTFAPTTPNILDLIDSYWMSKYRDGDRDSSGWRKTFYNIIENPVQVASKQIDFDTKDIKIIAEQGQDYRIAWFFEKELKLWMKENFFGMLLNEIIYKLPRYGHIVLKKVGNELKSTDLTNIVIEPTADNIEDNFVCEKHWYTPEELETIGEKLNWKNIELVTAQEPENGRYIIYEVYDPSSLDENWYIIYLGQKDFYAILKSGKIDNPYREHNWEKVSGRWLGRGYVEKLFENQIAENENENFFRKGLELSSKQIFQTRSETIRRNLLTQVDSGEVLQVQSEISQVPLEERNLAAYRFATDKWKLNTDLRTFAFDVIRGERPPAGTPLGSAQLAVGQAGSFFDLKREDIGMFLKKIISEDIIPEFKKQRRGKHIINLFNLAGDDPELENLNGIIKNQNIFRRVVLNQLKGRGFPTQREIDVWKAVEGELAKRPENRDIEIPEGVYENLKYKIDILITEEQIAVGAKLATLQVALQIIGSNPSIIQDPNTRRIFFEMLDIAGVSPATLKQVGATPTDVSQLVAQRGGSIPSTAPISTPAPLNVSRSL